MKTKNIKFNCPFCPSIFKGIDIDEIEEWAMNHLESNHLRQTWNEIKLKYDDALWAWNRPNLSDFDTRSKKGLDNYFIQDDWFIFENIEG